MHYAVRFAVKEAVAKAFGTGISPELGWQDIFVVADPTTRVPSVRFSPKGQALGITVRHSGQSLQGNEIWLERGIEWRPEQVIATTRIGVDYTGADAQRPWRFRVRAGAWTRLAK